MCVDGDRGLTKSSIQNDVCCFPANAGQRFEFFSSSWHFTAEFFEQNAAGLDDVPGFAVVETDCLNKSLQFVNAKVEYALGRISDRVEFAGRFIDANVSGFAESITAISSSNGST